MLGGACVLIKTPFDLQDAVARKLHLSAPEGGKNRVCNFGLKCAYYNIITAAIFRQFPRTDVTMGDGMGVGGGYELLTIAMKEGWGEKGSRC